MASMNDKDYYAILGVESTATKQEITKAFQQKARKLHPDVNKAPDAEERFKEVSEAYAVLSDEEKRARYDAMRSGSPYAGGYSGASGAQGYGNYYNTGGFGWGFPFGGMGYSSFNGRSQKRSRAYNPRAGADVVFELNLDDEKAKNGCRRGVTYQRYASCEACHGAGSVQSEHAKTCPTCGGSGHITVDLSSLFGLGAMSMECPECEGTGKVVADPCTSCGGTGRVLSASEVVIEVPADSHDGDEIRIANMGNAGTNGSSTGDFVCRVCVESERLNVEAARGLEMIGFAIPFIVFGLLFNTLASLSVIIAVPLIIGVYLLYRGGGILGRKQRWWKNAGACVLNGIFNGFTIALFLTLMVSCMSGFGTAGYVGRPGLRG